MKKTVGIITLHDLIPSPNYGNRLQNLAVQTVLEQMGFDVVTYSFGSDNLGTNGTLRYILHSLSGYRLTKNRDYWIGVPPRIFSFRKFNRKYIKTRRIHSINDIDKRDFYCVGSDQVWNAEWYGDDEFKKRIYLLSFADPSKRVCFAPSFGFDYLPENMKTWFRENLMQFPYLSVREDAGAKIIKDLTGRDASVLIDPTMLLDKTTWRMFEEKPKRVKEGYVLTYFLSSKCDLAKKDLKNIKGDRTVYELLNPDDNIIRSVDPCGFLWLFDHADVILTDSFHACVFSFLFNKPFVVYNRNWDDGNMNSRLETLLHKFHLERKYANSGLQNDIWEHDYEEGYKQLEIEREKAMNFLKVALKD